MSYPVEVLPDVELAVILYLRSKTALTTLVAGASITTRLPAGATMPRVLIHRGGGTPPEPRRLDEAAIQVDVLHDHEHQAEASAIARTIAAELVAIANDIVGACVLVSAQTEISPQWLPDTVSTPPLAQYVARFRVYAHNNT